MGECRVRLQLAASLSPKHIEGATSLFTFADKMWPSDATIREVVEIHDSYILDLLVSGRASLWNCTIHPVRNVTRDVVDLYPGKQGKNSLTLFSAGWFPSVSLQCLPRGQNPVLSSTEAYDDAQYNTREAISGSEQTVKLTNFVSENTSRPKPSDILKSVTARDTSSSYIENRSEEEAMQVRNENRRLKREREQARLERLHSRIRNLEGKGGASAQVKRMLIRSRATGRLNIEMKDRIHFKCYVVTGDNMDVATNCREDYRYFSRQDTIGKILSSFSSESGSDLQAEFLVSFTPTLSETSPPTYRRLSNLKRLYEAIDSKHMEDFATVIIRFYDPEIQESTSIFEEPLTVEMELETVAMDGMDQCTTPDKSSFPAGSKPEERNDGSKEQWEQLLSAIECYHSGSVKRTSKKPSTTASVKVKQMQMKSKAKGDVKRIKLPDRLYLELVVTHYDGEANDIVQSVEPIFVSKLDTVTRVVNDIATKTRQSSNWMVLVEGEQQSFRQIENVSQRMGETVKDFGKFILRYFPS